MAYNQLMSLRPALVLTMLALLGACSRRADRAPDKFQVTLATNKGDVVVEVTRDWAPLGADRFYNLVNEGFYDGARFFRVLPDFVVQFGIHRDPPVNQRWRELSIADDPVKQTNKRGTVSFAMSGPNTRTTQVFINLADNARLDERGFAPFGQVVSGMEAVDQFYSGYGEGAPRGNGPSQDLIQTQGNAYLEREFPRLDFIKKATIQN